MYINFYNKIFIYLVGSDTSSVDDTSMLEDIPKSPDESLSLSSTDPVLSKSSYIQELSSLIAESTKEDLNK